MRVGTDIMYIDGRNAGDSGYDNIMAFYADRKTGTPSAVIKSSGTIKFEDGAGSLIGFNAPAALGGSWNHELWSTSSNTGKVLTQTSDGGTRPLAFVNTFATSKTEAALKSDSPDAAGRIYYCSDCSVDAVVVSTGTGAGAVARLTARTTAIE